jgi:hypothetical protein
MKVLVTGGRDYKDYGVVAQELAKLKPDTIVQGGATGADHLARVWANANNVLCVTYPAQWKQHGKKAGYLRNKQMLEEEQPDLVLAFPGGKGTANMVKIATDNNTAVQLAPLPSEQLMIGAYALQS